MFVSDKVPSNYLYIAEISDNYVVLVNQSKLYSGISYDAYYQYFSPSEMVVHVTDYRIKQGDEYVFHFYYDNNQFYNYIDYVEPTFSVTCNQIDNVETTLFDRPDYWSVLSVVFYLVLLYILIVNLASALIHKGGLFSG